MSEEFKFECTGCWRNQEVEVPTLVEQHEVTVVFRPDEQWLVALCMCGAPLKPYLKEVPLDDVHAELRRFR